MDNEEIIREKIIELIDYVGTHPLGIVLNAYMGAALSGQEKEFSHMVADYVDEVLMPNVKNAKAQRN